MISRSEFTNNFLRRMQASITSILRTNRWNRYGDPTTRRGQRPRPSRSRWNGLYEDASRQWRTRQGVTNLSLGYYQDYKVPRRLLTKLLPTDVPEPTWDYFVTFLKETISPLKQRVAKIGSQLTQLRQRPGQSVAQLVTYLKVLDDQWPEILNESVRAMFLLQALQAPIKKEISRQNVGTLYSWY